MALYKTNADKTEKVLADIKRVIDNRHKIPDEFWTKRDGSPQEAIWLFTRGDGTACSYETSEERLGITRDGEMIWGYLSGCSCIGGWEQDGVYCPTRSYKEFLLTLHVWEAEDKYGTTHDKDAPSFESGWVDDCRDGLDDFLLLLEDDKDPLKVLACKNAEIRRYIMKRIGYDKIKNHAKTSTIHVDGTSELLKINDELYVKVKDASTPREYLLWVPNNYVNPELGGWFPITTCREAIAWTFDLLPENYAPRVES